MLDRFEFLVSEAVAALRRNGLMTFAAVSTVAVSLFLLGGLGYVYWRIAGYAATIPGKFEMRVFMKDGASLAEVQSTAATIRAINGVSAVFWIPKDKAWALEKQRNPENTEGIDNPYPDAFKVKVTDLALSDGIASQIRALPTVQPERAVVYLQEEQNFVDQGMRLIRWLGSVFGGLLFLTGGVLIYNAIKLTIESRRLEIRTMQLVGASRFMIRVPFLIEGIVQGCLGGILASLMVLAGNESVVRFIGSMKGDASTVPFPLGLMLAILCSIGAVYGLICSMMAVRRPLKLR